MLERFRYTVLQGEIPLAHGNTQRAAVAAARTRGKPTRVILRRRAYPFETLRARPL